jgi:hypothetical protein
LPNRRQSGSNRGFQLPEGRNHLPSWVQRFAQQTETMQSLRIASSELTHAQLMKWKTTMSADEWDRLMVVNRARHQARYRNAATQYFQWFLADKGPSCGYPGEGMRVIYAESLAPNEKASDELATVLIDADASTVFFGDSWRISEDILSGGAERCIRKLPDSDPLHP